MREFAELSGMVRREDWVDNKKAALKVKDGKYDGARRDIAHRFVDMINKLHDHMVQSVIDLKENEIAAAYDLITWLTESHKELLFLE